MLYVIMLSQTIKYLHKHVKSGDSKYLCTFPDIAKIKFDISGLENSSRQLAMMSLCA